MSRITNAKLRRVTPLTWRRYPGVSILYDNPGSVGLSGLEPLLPATSPAGGNRSLYQALRAVTCDIAWSLPATGLLATLPEHTYHVTLCDGVNEGTQVRPGMRGEVQRVLDELPDSLLGTTALMRLVQDRELFWTVRTHPVSFRVAGLSVWGHVLAAQLEPADDRSVAAKARHEAARSELMGRLRARMGVQPGHWGPHVSLGYFAHDDGGAYAREHVIPGWEDEVLARTEGLSMTFRSASVYGFTDMVTFWRLAH